MYREKDYFERMHTAYLKEDAEAYRDYLKAIRHSNSLQDEKVAALNYIKDLEHLKNKYECVKYTDEKFVNTSIELIQRYGMTEGEVSKKLNGTTENYVKPDNVIAAGNTVIVFNCGITNFDDIDKMYTKDLEYAYESFKEALCMCSNPTDRKASAHSYLDDIIHIKVKYEGCSESMDKETTMIIKSLCELYGFTNDEVKELYDFHSENDNRAVNVYTVLEPIKASTKELSKGPSKELSLSRE